MSDVNYDFFPVGSMSLAGKLNDVKERCKHAVKCQVVIDEDENGFVYEAVSEDRAMAEVGHLIDAIAYDLLDLLSFSRASETVMDQFAEKLDVDNATKLKMIVGAHMAEVKRDDGEYGSVYQYDDDDALGEMDQLDGDLELFENF